MKRNRLNNFTENLIRLTVLERISQLEKTDISGSNILNKQLELKDVVDEAILYANKAPQGQIEIVFTDKTFKDKTSVERILLNSVCRISAFNMNDPESKKVLFRTVIIIDPKWTNDFDIYQCQYGYDDSYLKRS